MPKITLPLLLGFILAGWILAAPLSAQQSEPGTGESASLVDAASLEARVLSSQHPAEALRADVQSLLATEEARTIADEHGLDLARASGAVATLSDSEIEATAPLVEKAKEALQQGRTITISVYTVIIILLLLILIT